MVLSGSTCRGEVLGRGAPHALARAAHALEHRHRARRRSRARCSSAASLAGVSPSHDSARMRAPGCRWRTMPSSARPCRLTGATSCNDQPSRAAARLNAEGCGRQSVSSGGDRAHQQVADAEVKRIAARQHDDRPAAMLLDLGQRLADRARPRELARRLISASASARCRSPPTTSSASDDQARAPPATGRRRRPRRCRRWTASAAGGYSRPCPCAS